MEERPPSDSAASGEPGPGVEARLRALRKRADDDFAAPPAARQPGRHQIDVEDLGLRVSLTRNRYPERPDGVDQYAVTISRLAMDRGPEEAQTRRVLHAAFGDELAGRAARRPGGELVRMFRVPAAAADVRRG